MKLRTIFLIYALLALTGCQFAMVPTATITDTHNAFRVALLLPRPRDADGWTRSGYDGLVLIQEELGAEIAYSENVPEDQFEAVFRQYAQEGYDFIIGHGNQFIPAAEKVAAEFPNIAFAVDGKYGGNNVNLGALSLREGEMGYLFGVIAAIKTHTNRVGYIGGQDNVSQQEITTMFLRGLQATNPKVELTVDFVGNFTDSARAEQLAEEQIKSGIDVIFVLAGAAGMGIHKQAQDAGIFTLAWIEDLNHLAPKAVVTSNVQNVPAMMLRGAILVTQGRWEGKQYKFGLAEGAQDLAPFRGLLTPQQEAQVNAAKMELITGKIDQTP